MTIDWILIAGDFLSVHLTQHSVVIHQLLLQPEYDPASPASPGAISLQPWGTASTIRNFEQLLVNVNKFGQINPIIGICSIQNQECELFVIVCGLIWWNDVHTYILKPCKRTYSYILFPYYLYIYCIYIYDTCNTTYHWRYIPMDPSILPKKLQFVQYLSKSRNNM